MFPDVFLISDCSKSAGQGLHRLDIKTVRDIIDGFSVTFNFTVEIHLITDTV